MTPRSGTGTRVKVRAAGLLIRGGKILLLEHDKGREK